MDLREHAVILARRGLPVFKISNNRLPLAQRFWERASNDPVIVEKMWTKSDGSADNSHNIGVLCGGDLIVVDIDVKRNQPGRESFALLGLPTDTFTVLTTSAGERGELGRHLYYRVPNGIWRNRPGWFPGVDVWGEHHYVVGPGSTGANGLLYKIIHDWPIAEMPEAFLSQFKGVQTDSAGSTSDLEDDPAAVTAAIKFLVNDAPILTIGGRDSGVIKIANRILDLGVTAGTTAELIVEHWLETKCDPPLSPESVAQDVEHAARYRRQPIGYRPPAPPLLDCFKIEGSQPERWSICPADWQGKPVPVREWIVPEMIPAGTVTILSGNGGAGKSLLALQLCAAMAIGQDWINRRAEPGRSVFFSGEDDSDELHRRVSGIARHYGVELASLRAMQLRDNTAVDSILGAKTAVGSIAPTQLYHKLYEHITESQPKLVVIDTLADTFGGDEIVRSQSRQFIGLLRQLCARCNTTVLVLAHPSLNGMATGEGTSGSTGWSNAVRSRLYLDSRDGASYLTAKKSNYGPLSAEIKLAWQCGAFSPAVIMTAEETREIEEKAEAEFQEHLRRLLKRGMTLTDNGQGHAVKAIINDLGFDGNEAKLAARRFTAAMGRLLDMEVLRIETYRKPDRKEGRRLVFS